MGTAYPDLQHITTGFRCESILRSGERCATIAHQLCVHCNKAVCGRHEDQHALCPVKVKK